eukprot:CAMPEP_0202690086 /NCGR_PEP_ID=MMETSP1385-20130828/5203_1 /ASSEMBLY_ACC=CAM_ASM_000861 /TAXON_ID=933848 /ORGANISM="Elphidium margaritaceum" /LENGTH=921 /DNA_ID=CAMNT_0049345315 /DNA_START=42 /DNA_END=2807 /DNA_ORIENTATION=+
MTDTTTTLSSSSSTNTLSGKFSISTDEFVSQLYISIPIGIGLVFFYCVVRKLRPRFWEVRRRYAQVVVEQEESEPDFVENIESESQLFAQSTFSLPKYMTKVTYPRISSGFLWWLWDVWSMDAQTFYKHAGFDALVFRIYLKACMYICLTSLPFALLVLVPIYATSHAASNTEEGLTQISINSVGEQSDRLWAAVVGCYIFTLIAMYYLSIAYLRIAYAADQFLIGNYRLSEIDNISWFSYRKMIDNVVELNVKITATPIEYGGKIISQVQRYVVKQPSELLSDHPASAAAAAAAAADVEAKDAHEVVIEERKQEQMELLSDAEYTSDAERTITDSVPSIDRYTIMIRDVPPAFRDEQALHQFMHELFPGKVARVTIIPNCNELLQIRSAIRFHSKSLRSLSRKHAFDLRDLYDDSKLPTIYEGSHCCGCCGEDVNVITYHRTHRDALVAKFRKQRAQGLASTPTAFVTFSCLKAASIAISCPIRFGVSNLRIAKAPYPNDIFWENLKYGTNELMPNNLVVAVAMFFLLIFWSIPVAAIQGLANLEAIFNAFDANIDDYLNETTVTWLQGSLTVLILDLWLLIIPAIVTALTRFQHKTHRGRLETIVLVRYYDCLVFMVLLVTVITGTTVSNAENFADYAENIVSSMNAIVNLLADGLSNMAIYFMLYVLLNTFIWLPLELFRPSYYFALYLSLAEPNRFRYSLHFAKTMLILTIVLTFGVMHPIMWCLGLVYFVFAVLSFTYTLSMSWIPEFETGAKQWPQVYGRLRFGFLISIFTLVGLMALKQAYLCAAALLPLAGFSWYATTTVTLNFQPVFNAPSLTSASQKDRQINAVINKNDENGILQFGDVSNLNNAYLPPIMTVEYLVNNDVFYRQQREQQGKKNKKSKKKNHQKEQEDMNVVAADAGAAAGGDEYDSYQNA